jgi:sulfur carrier protein
VKVRLRNPDRELEVAGPRKVRDVLSELGIDPDTVLVIRDRSLVTREERLDDADEIEVRPVISGGSGGQQPRGGGAGADQAAAPRPKRAAAGGRLRIQEWGTVS